MKKFLIGLSATAMLAGTAAAYSPVDSFNPSQPIEFQEVSYEAIAPFTTAGQVGTVHTAGDLRTNATWSNVNNPRWHVPAGSRVVHTGQRVFDGDSWGWFERVTVTISGVQRTGWLHGDHIRW